jgi:predicted HicB family RNase H-like nuclease
MGPDDRTFPLRMPRSTYELAKALAAQQHISVRELLLRALDDKIRTAIGDEASRQRDLTRS